MLGAPAFSGGVVGCAGSRDDACDTLFGTATGAAMLAVTRAATPGACGLGRIQSTPAPTTVEVTATPTSFNARSLDAPANTGAAGAGGAGAKLGGAKTTGNAA